MSIYKMTSSQIMKFALLYRDAECLWDVNLKEYKDRDARNRALNKIAEEMDIEGFGPREVAQKIKNLRSAYYQELKKIINSRKTAVTPSDIYKPKVGWFDVVNVFLRKVSQSTPNQEIQEDETQTVTINVSPNLPPLRRTQNKKQKVSSTIQSVPSSSHNNTNVTVHKPEKIHRTETEFDVWAKSIAMQLNNMELSRALRLQLRIQSLLTEERIAHECNRQDTTTVTYGETHLLQLEQNMEIKEDLQRYDSNILPDIPCTSSTTFAEPINVQYIPASKKSPATDNESSLDSFSISPGSNDDGL